MTSTAATVTHAVLARHVDVPGSLLPILHEIQDTLGYIPAEHVPDIAGALNLSRAEVHGVITYYHFFRTDPPGRHVVLVCRAESCKAMGADALMAHAEQALGCTIHGAHGATSADGRFTLNPVYCLGLCATSPSMVIDDRLHARMTPARFDRAIAAIGSQE